ncbi:MAG: hypothetical protein AAF629_20625 [Chloroflexota bacterium]
MKTDLTQAQINAYIENGYIVIRDFLILGELEVWRDAVDEAVSRSW